MAHWRVGEKKQSREDYDKAVAWMEKHKPGDEELKRFRLFPNTSQDHESAALTD